MVIHELLLKVVVLGALFGSYHNRITEAADSMTKPRCRGACGTLSIPYPFGSSDSCSSCRINHPSFIVDCDNSTNPPVSHLNKRSNNIIIFNISLENHEIGVNVSSSQECYDSYGNNGSPSIYSRLSLVDFPISSTKNKFITVGCDTWASLRARDGNYPVVCASFCNYVSDASNGVCSGSGCCETSIPRGSFGYGISIGSFYEHKYVLDFNPCSYGFVAKNGFYNFSIGNLKQLEFNQSTVVLDWAIGNQTCEDTKKNHKYKCTNNTDAESINGVTFRNSTNWSLLNN